MKQTITTLFSCLLVLSACGGGGGDTTLPDLEEPPDMTSLPDLVPQIGPYPPAPYGVEVGDTLYSVYSFGYRLSPEQTDSTQLPWETINISDMHFDPRCKCLLLTESGSWCQPCRLEQPALIDFVANNPSFCVYGVLVDGPTPGKRATQADVQLWTQTFNENFPVVGPSFQTVVRLPRPDALPTNAVIEPRSMKILDITTGIDTSDPQEYFRRAQTMCDEAAPAP